MAESARGVGGWGAGGSARRCAGDSGGLEFPVCGRGGGAVALFVPYYSAVAGRRGGGSRGSRRVGGGDGGVGAGRWGVLKFGRGLYGCAAVGHRVDYRIGFCCILHGFPIHCHASPRSSPSACIRTTLYSRPHPAATKPLFPAISRGVGIDALG